MPNPNQPFPAPGQTRSRANAVAPQNLPQSNAFAPQTRPRSNAVFVTEVTDAKAAERARELVNDVFEGVMKNAPGFTHRVVHGGRTFVHTDVRNNARSQVGHVAGVGIAVAAAASVPFTAGLSVVAPVLIGLSAWGFKKGLSACMHSHMKKQVKQAIRGGHWPTAPLDEKTTALSMDMLNSFVYDLDELKKDYQNYKKTAKKKKASALSFEAMREQAMGNFDHFSKQRANYGLIGGPDAYTKVCVRIARLVYYGNWLLIYLKIFEKEANGKVERAAEQMKGLFEQIVRQVHWGGNHQKCANVCYGPSFDQLLTRSIPEAQHRAEIEAAMRVLDNPAALERLRPKQELRIVSPDEQQIDSLLTPENPDLLEKFENNAGVEAFKEATEFEAGYAGNFVASTLAGNPTDSSDLNTMQADLITEAFEVANVSKSLIQKNYSQAILDASLMGAREAASIGATRAGAAVGTMLNNASAGNAVTALINETVGIAIEKTKESFTYNRPVLKSVETMLNGSVAGEQPKVDQEIATLLEKGKKGVMDRLLRKVNFHYPYLVGKYAKEAHAYVAKFEQRIQGGRLPIASCTEACEAVKRVVKIHRYAGKLHLHLALLRSGIQSILAGIYLEGAKPVTGNKAVFDSITNESL
jgi:hypothetical protein